MPEPNRIYAGDCIEVMKTWPADFVDTIITDPPYGIRFMGKAWDGADIEKTIDSKRRHTPRTDSHGGYSIENRAWAAGEYDRSPSANLAFQMWCTEWAAAALRIAKPGALMLVSGGTRTFHRMTAGLEDAGWQIRDCLMWLYGSGFPKSLDISKAIDKAKGAERKDLGPSPYADKGRTANNHVYGEPTASVAERVTAPATDLARQWSGWGTALACALMPQGFVETPR